MAVTVTLSNHYKYQLAHKLIDLSADGDTIKICLMADGFTFNPDTHATWADVSASELAENYGYVRDTKTLLNKVLTEDDTDNRSEMVCDDITWTADGGAIGPSPGAILYDDTTADNTVIGYIDFGADRTAADTLEFIIQDIELYIS